MDLVKEFWAIIVGIVSLIAWGLRTEAKTKSNAKEIQHVHGEIKHLWKRRDEDYQNSKSAREEANHKLEIISGDVKQILSRGDQ